MILTIDVGLKNLAMCIMGCDDSRKLETYRIHLWEVYNTLEDETKLCKNQTKKGILCNKKCSCKYTHTNTTVFCCKTHFPKTMKMTASNQIKKKRVDDFLLQDIAGIVLDKLKQIYADNENIFKQVTKVLIELQPKVNNKMKFISHLIYGKFVELLIDTNVPIRFVRASQKLKAYKGPPINCDKKGGYAKRKYLSIEYTKWFLKTQFDSSEHDKWMTIFDNVCKQDDLADCFLMAINGCTTKPNKKT